MRRILNVTLTLTALAGVLTACSDEDPTGVGSELVGESVRTYEVVLEAGEFLQSDTTFDRIGSLNQARLWLVAEDFAGVLDARTLISVDPPETVQYEDSTTTQVDSVARIVGGTLTLVVDTLASTAGPIDLEVYELSEEWDWRTTTWDLRSDTAGGEPWATPGGTLGPLLASAQWTGGDTLRIPLDSQTVSVWTDSVGAMRGGVIRSTTPGSRLLLESILFQFDVVPSEAPDTVIPAGTIENRVSIVTPEATAPDVDELRVGGIPSWRSLLRFQPLRGLGIPCGEPSAPECTVPLEDVTINLAVLVLEPLPVGARRIERPIWIENHGVQVGPAGVPLSRSPLTGVLGGTQDSLTAELFDGTTADLDPVPVPVTLFVRRLVNPDVEDLEWLALTAAGEPVSAFGYGAFGSLASPWPPRLRLVVSVPEEVVEQ